MKLIVSISVLDVGRDRHHCGNDPADVNWITPALNVLCQVFQRILGIVQDLKTDVHYKVFELGEAERSRGEGDKHNEHQMQRQVEGKI